METFIGTILPFGFNYAPADWSTCQGQQMAVSQYNALFALLGVMYGGNGTTNFNLPDLQGRMPIGAGNGVGLTPRIQGAHAGTENIALTLNNLPAHTHSATLTIGASGSVQVSTNTAGNSATPSASNNILSASGTGQGSATIWSNTMTAPVTMGGVNLSPSGTVTIGSTGNSLPAASMNPFLVLNFCIALQGLWPPHP